jgi:hypothetical protein
VVILGGKAEENGEQWDHMGVVWSILLISTSLHHYQPWASYFTSQSLSFIVCEMGTTTHLPHKAIARLK